MCMFQSVSHNIFNFLSLSPSPNFETTLRESTATSLLCHSRHSTIFLYCNFHILWSSNYFWHVYLNRDNTIGYVDNYSIWFEQRNVLVVKLTCNWLGTTETFVPLTYFSVRYQGTQSVARVNLQNRSTAHLENGLEQPEVYWSRTQQMCE